MTNSIQNFFNNPRVKIIIASIIIFIAVTGISIYLRNLLTNPDPTCQSGYFYDESEKKCLIKCGDGQINDPSDLSNCIPDCQSRTNPAPGQTYNPATGTCQFKCGTNWCSDESWLCTTGNFCATPNCYDSSGNETLYCNNTLSTNNTCARNSTGALVAGASGATITNGCYTSNDPLPVPTQTITSVSGQTPGTGNVCSSGYSLSAWGIDENLCCPTGNTAVAANSCCPTGNTNFLNSKYCCPTKDADGKTIKQVIKGVCCPATSKDIVNGKCCDNPQTFSTESGPQTICCSTGEDAINGGCCPSASICKYKGKTSCLTEIGEECTVDGPCPTSQVYVGDDGNKHCCDEKVTEGNCYNVCNFQPDPSIMSGSNVMSYTNKNGDVINGITKTSTGKLTCGYAYQKDNTDQYLTCINNSNTKTSVCDASAVCTTNLVKSYTSGGVKNSGGKTYYYCGASGDNYWNGQTGSTLEFNYSITPTSGATGPICQNVNMCQNNYPSELAITGTPSITINGENCGVTLSCTGISQTPPIAPVMSIVQDVHGIKSYNGSITGGSYTVTLGPGANFLNSGQYAINGSIDGNSPAANQISGSFCSPAAAGNTYDNNKGNSILCYNSGDPLNYTPKFYSNVTNGFGCDGNGFITGNSQDTLTCNCTIGSFATKNLSCYNQNVSAILGYNNTPLPKQLKNLQVFYAPTNISSNTNFTGNQQIQGSQTRSIIFFKVTNNKYKNFNGQYLNYPLNPRTIPVSGSEILTSSSNQVNIMYISWNATAMYNNAMWQRLPLLSGLLFASSNNTGGGISGTSLLPIITYLPENGTVNLDVYNFSSGDNGYNTASSPYTYGNTKVGYFLTIAATNTGFYCIAAVSAILGTGNNPNHFQDNIYFLAAKDKTTLQWISPTNSEFIKGNSKSPFKSPLPSNLIIANPLTSLSVSAFDKNIADDKFLSNTNVSTITSSIAKGTGKGWTFDDILGKLQSGFNFSKDN